MTLRCHFNAKNLFFRRFDWSRSRRFWTRNYVKAKKRYTYICSQQQKSISEALVSGDIKLYGHFRRFHCVNGDKCVCAYVSTM